VDWDGLNQVALNAEMAEGGFGRRIVHVWHPAPNIDVWTGIFGSAPVSSGPSAYQLSDGEIVTL